MAWRFWFPLLPLENYTNYALVYIDLLANWWIVLLTLFEQIRSKLPLFINTSSSTSSSSAAATITKIIMIHIIRRVDIIVVSDFRLLNMSCSDTKRRNQFDFFFFVFHAIEWYSLTQKYRTQARISIGQHSDSISIEWDGMGMA